MGWKNWPSWLRGGVIGIIIWFILFFAGIILVYLDLAYFGKCSGDVCSGTFIGILGNFMFSISAWTLILLGHYGYLYYFLYIIIGIIINILSYFLVSSFVALIITKIKERKR